MRNILTILLVIAAVFFLFWTKPESKAELQSIPLSKVVVAQVEQSDLQPIITLTGKLQPAKHVHLRLELSGRVQSRLIEPGQEVQAGEVLLAIDDGDFLDRKLDVKSVLEQEEKAIARDRALLKLIQEEIEIQQREIARQERLGQESLSSKSSYDSALRTLLSLKAEESNLRNSVSTANSRLNTRRAMVSQADRNLERTRLRAPFNARVNKVEYEVGDYAVAGQLAVELVQLREMDLYLEVTGSTMSILSIDQEIEINTDTGKRQGKIIAIEPEPREDTLTHGVRIRVDGQNLYSGQLAKANLPSKPLKDVAVIPVSAVLYEEGNAFVFVVNDNELVRLPVELLARVGELQSVSGVEIGSLVVAQDVAALADGQKVNVK